MTDAGGSGKSWLKYGCLGCLGVLGLGIVILATVGGLAWQRAASIQNESQVLTQEVPAPATRALSPEEIAADLPDAARQLLGEATPGRVILDFSQGDFHIEPGAPGEPVRVEASYDDDYYELEEHYEQDEGGGWTYLLRFQRTAPWSIIGTLSEFFSGTSPDVRVYLPADVLMALELDVKQGGTQADLGGLWLASADLSYEMGGIDVRIGEPLRAPIERLSIQGSMGGASFRSLGNASPRLLEVDFSMGGLELDLRGAWREDAEIDIKASMGGGAVWLPRDVTIEGLDEHDRTPRSEGDQPTLKFTVTKRRSDLEFMD